MMDSERLPREPLTLALRKEAQAWYLARHPDAAAADVGRCGEDGLPCLVCDECIALGAEAIALFHESRTSSARRKR